MLKGRMSSKPRMWSACPWVSRMASRRSRLTRRACWRKSGVVSITTFCPLRESRRDGRRRLSWGSFEVQTRQWQAREGTPMEVPEPRMVTFMGAADIGSVRLYLEMEESAYFAREESSVHGALPFETFSLRPTAQKRRQDRRTQKCAALRAKMRLLHR